MPTPFTRRSFLAAVAASAPLPALAVENWPAFRGRGASGSADGFSVPTHWNADPSLGAVKGVLWRADIPGLGHSSPVIWEDRLFLATAVRSVGEASLQLGLFGDSTAAEDGVEHGWNVLCYDRRSGEELWQTEAWRGVPRASRHIKATQANTTVATDGRHVVAFFGSEGLHCLDLHGRVLWRKDLGVINVSKYGIGWGFAASPALSGDRIVVQCDAPGDQFIAAFRLTDGSELWRTSRTKVCERSWSTPLIHTDGERAQVVANGWPYIVSYDLESGRELWRLKGGGDNPIPTPFVAHGLIYVANAHGGPSPLFAIRPDARGDISLAEGTSSNDHVVWHAPRAGAYISTPLAYRDLVYACSTKGIVQSFEARSGRRHYQERLGTGVAISSSPVGADGKIFFTTEEGTVVVVAAGPEFEVLARNPLGEPCMATPAIAGGALYFRTTKSLIAVGGSGA
jgi:outer membrane protein assembly factor BamB